MPTRKSYRHLMASIDRSLTRLRDIDLADQAASLRDTAVGILQNAGGSLNAAIKKSSSENAEASEARQAAGEASDKAVEVQARIFNGLRGTYYMRAAAGTEPGEAQDYLQDLGRYLEDKNASDFAGLSLDDKIHSLETAVGFVPKFLEGDLAGDLAQQGQQALQDLKDARAALDAEGAQAIEAGQVLERAFANASTLYLAARDAAGAALRMSDKYETLSRHIPPLRAVFDRARGGGDAGATDEAEAD